MIPMETSSDSALSAQQRAFAAASAVAHVESNEESNGSASTSAAGIAYAEQSLHTLVSVNDQLRRG